jgi:ABC-type antimicrobial peptide transport system permease subunit
MTTLQADARPVQGNQENVHRSRSWWQDVWRRFAQQRAPLAAGMIFLILLLLALLAPLIAPYDPVEQFRREGLSPMGG